MRDPLLAIEVHEVARAFRLRKRLEELDPEVADAPIVRSRIDNAKIATVMSNSFGFGGTNASLVFQRYGA